MILFFWCMKVSPFLQEKVFWQKGNDAFKLPDATSLVCLNNKLIAKLHQMFSYKPWLFFVIISTILCHLETHHRPTTAEPRHPVPKLHPVSPDWVAAATRKPDLNRRVVTSNPRAFELIISCCTFWGRWSHVHSGHSLMGFPRVRTLTASCGPSKPYR